jgi:hypothetical protein
VAALLSFNISTPVFQLPIAKSAAFLNSALDLWCILQRYKAQMQIGAVLQLGVIRMKGSGKESPMYKTLLSIMVWVFFLGGLFGFVMGMLKYFGGGTAAEYGVMGIGGGFWLLCSAIAIHIRTRLQ